MGWRSTRRTATRYVRQYFDGQWTASDGGPFNRLLAYRPVGAPFARHADAIKERDNSAFYSQVATIAHHRGGAAAPTHTQVLIGTTRVWYTEDWAGDWVTLPRATDPITTTTFDKDQDDFGEPITVCKWATSDVAWILGERKLMRLVREKDSDVANPPGSWDDDVVLNLNRKASKTPRPRARTARWSSGPMSSRTSTRLERSTVRRARRTSAPSASRTTTTWTPCGGSTATRPGTRPGCATRLRRRSPRSAAIPRTRMTSGSARRSGCGMANATSTRSRGTGRRC